MRYLNGVTQPQQPPAPITGRHIRPAACMTSNERSLQGYGSEGLRFESCRVHS